ncbi:MAG TPA: hypothetical protein VJM79_00425 [Rhizorhapis sp.]|nr:hypothetical protein [Rhizorhapis sp.]
MKCERIALLDAVNTVKPALAVKDLIEELAHVWFDGQTMTAYNDADLGIQVPFETPFIGGIRGSLLLGLLINSRAKDVELDDSEEGHMKIVAARTRAKLAVLDAERAVWQFPEINRKAALDITPDFVRALKAVLVSVGNDTSIPEKLGVTLLADDELRMFTTDSKAICGVSVAMPKGKGLRKGDSIILPTAFCEQILRLCAAGGFLELRKDCAIAGNASGVLVYARLVDVTKPLPFVETIDRHNKFPKGARFEIPSKLALALERSIVLLEGLVGETVNISAMAGKLRLEASAEGRGTIKDFITLPEGVPDIEINVDPSLVKRALVLATHMAINSDAVVLTGDDGLVYLASTGAV